MREIKQSEDNLQKSCVKWLKLQYPNLTFIHVPNGGKRNVREAVKFKAMGVRSGCPDLLVFKPADIYAGLAIELKVGKNTTTDNQKAFIDELTGNGWYCVVVYNIEAFMRAVNGYMSNVIQ